MKVLALPRAIQELLCSAPAQRCYTVSREKDHMSSRVMDGDKRDSSLPTCFPPGTTWKPCQRSSSRSHALPYEYPPFPLFLEGSRREWSQGSPTTLNVSATPSQSLSMQRASCQGGRHNSRGLKHLLLAQCPWQAASASNSPPRTSLALLPCLINKHLLDDISWSKSIGLFECNLVISVTSNNLLFL